MKLKITVVVDNKSKNSKFLSEHGLSFHIQVGHSQILFDTGQGKALRQNMRLLDIKPEQINSVVFSHGHYDHTSGISKIFPDNSEVKIYAHPGILAKKYSCHGKGSGKFIGVRPSDSKWIDSHRKFIKWTAKPSKITTGIYVTGEIPRLTDFEDVGGPFYLNKRCTIPDAIVDDQALFIKTKKGVVIVLGCAHAGVVNTMTYVARFTKTRKIYAVLGGAHLLRASNERIKKTLEAFDKYKVQIIALGHCTGGDAMKIIKKRFPKEFLPLKAGMEISIE